MNPHGEEQIVIVVVIMKICKKCLGSEFYKNGRCKSCHRAVVAAHYKRNTESKAEYRKANSEKTKLYDAELYAKNCEEIKARNKKWRALNKHKTKEIERRWRLANKELCKVIAHNRRARKRNNGGVLSKGLSEKLFRLQRGRCACCGNNLGTKYHLDHIIPLSSGGKNEDSNIQLLKVECNLKKHTKHPIDYMRSKGFLL